MVLESHQVREKTMAQLGESNERIGASTATAYALNSSTLLSETCSSRVGRQAWEGSARTRVTK